MNKEQSQNGNHTQNHTHGKMADQATGCAEDDVAALQFVRIIKGRYSFRCRVPLDVVPWFRGKEIIKALHTTDKKQARALASAWQQKVTNLFTFLRLSSADAELKKEFVKSEIYPKNSTTSKKPLKLQALIDDYIIKKADSWREKTALEVEASLRLIAEIIGDEPLHHLDLNHVQKVKTALQKLPANMKKNPTYKDLRVSQILKMPNIVPMSTVTANKRFQKSTAMV